MAKYRRLYVIKKMSCCFDDITLFFFISICAVSRIAVFPGLTEMEKHI